MKQLKILLVIAAALVAAQAGAADLTVICASGVSLTAADIRGVFLGDKQFASGIKLAPADNKALQAVFLEKVLMMDAAKYTALWTKKSFRDGTTPPGMKNSDVEIIEYVKHTPGACGYVSGDAPAGTTLIGKF
jgi:hypothetical protein